MRLDVGIDYELAVMLALFQRPAHKPYLAAGLVSYHRIGGPTNGDWLSWYEQWKERYVSR